VLKLYTHRSKAFWKSVYHIPRPRSSSRRTGNGGDWASSRCARPLARRSSCAAAAAATDPARRRRAHQVIIPPTAAADCTNCSARPQHVSPCPRAAPAVRSSWPRCSSRTRGGATFIPRYSQEYRIPNIFDGKASMHHVYTEIHISFHWELTFHW
jgi:hypothetical protein